MSFHNLLMLFQTHFIKNIFNFIHLILNHIIQNLFLINLLNFYILLYIFYISSKLKDGDLNNSTDNSSSGSKEHEVRIYRFWSYDPVNQIPNETAYYVKICSIVNYNNPVFVKSSVDRKGLPFLMKRNRENNNQNLPANYLINSEYFVYFLIN